MKRKLIFAFCVVLILSVCTIFSSGCSSKAEKDDSHSKQRIDIFAQQLTSMAARAKKYTDTDTMAFVVFIYTDDIFVQSTTDESDRVIIDLPIQIMSDDRVRILKENFSNIGHSFAPGEQMELIAYQLYFDDSDIQGSTDRAAAAIDCIFLKVFGLQSDYSVKEIRTEKGQVLSRDE